MTKATDNSDVPPYVYAEFFRRLAEACGSECVSVDQP
jgi:hypothetical protein